jgi:hypothetical protein
MSEFFSLPRADQRAVLLHASDQSGRPAHLLEKDIWVVWILNALFAGPPSAHLVFKGGTSLSKAYGIIRRFSEDVDLTYDIHAIAGDLLEAAAEPLPPTRSQEKRWTGIIRARLPKVIEEQFVPLLAQALHEQGIPADVRSEKERVFIDYESLVTPSAYVRPSVMLEFGARSTGEPHEFRPICCDVAEFVPEVQFPSGSVQVMRPERTFWEKATAIHVFCRQGASHSGERYSRHWHDLTRLNRAGYAERAIVNQVLAREVANHKAHFFREKDDNGGVIDYTAAVSGHLQLIPQTESLSHLADDYARMLDDGLLPDDAEPFEQLIEECRRIEDQANRKRS